MLSKVVQDTINDQIKNELYSAYLYLSMSAYFEATNLRGCAHWMRVQSQEEVSHAMKFFEFVFDRGGRVMLQAIDQPPVDFKSPLDIFQQSLQHEQKVTAMINHIYELAVKENDYATQTFVQWFITEQVEEEKNAGQIVDQLKAIGDQPAALFMLDGYLGKRGD
jgi:ferritin